MRSYSPRSLALALTLALGGCSGSDGDAADPFTRATPDVAGLAIETPPMGGRLSCGQLDGMCNLGAAAAGVNASLRAVLEQVEAAAARPWIARSGPEGAETAGSFVQHGPVHVPAAEPVVSFYLWVESMGAGGFRWRLDALAYGTTTPMVTVAVGRVAAGDRAHRGSGLLGIDLGALAGLGPQVAARFLGTGQILITYQNDDGEKAVLYRLAGFDPDATDTAPAVPDGVVFAFQRADGRAGLRMSFDEAILPDATFPAVAERVLGRVSWKPSVGAAAASIVTGVDAASFGGDHLVLLSCTDASGTDTYRRLFACDSAAPAGEMACVLATGVPSGFHVGTPEQCPAGVPRFTQTTPPPRSAPNSCESEPMAGLIPVPPPASMAELLF